ncbi:hypothetical protein SAMN05421676_101111 [Salinibacillus kushneri]|uniref:Uncharacterized protein n=1 Tax=Salinibacillus kushneri TaxID=237682 RepID=A0A1H9YCE5_9BACI|nr:hypothetical protein [Salinibacillus kushneri]SES66606.1 hypothetical protein SAMN05421676_101111 [Salinibacillus kushneri]
MDKWNQVLSFLQVTIIIYLIFMPINYLINAPLLFPEYIIAVFLLGVLLAEIRQRVTTYAPYILLIPIVIFVCMYFFKLSWFVAIVLGFTLIFVFIHQLKEGSTEKETAILLTTFLLAVAEALIFSNPDVIWVAMVQFFLLFIGFYTRHYISHQQKTEQELTFTQMIKIPGLLSLIFLFISFLFLLFFEPVRSIFKTLLHWLAVFLTYILRVVGFGIDLTGITNIDVEPSEQSSMSKIDENMNQNQYQFLGEDAQAVINQSVNVLIWIGFFLLVVTALYLTKKFFNGSSLAIRQNKSRLTFIFLITEMVTIGIVCVAPFFSVFPESRITWHADYFINLNNLR